MLDLTLKLTYITFLEETRHIEVWKLYFEKTVLEIANWLGMLIS